MLNPTISLKTSLKNGGAVAGIFVCEIRSPNLAPLLDAAGYDFAIFDMEHCSYTMHDLSYIIPGFRGFRCQPLVRVPAVRREFFQSVLDIGVAGIVVPMVESAEDVREALAMMKYPPEGRRGLSFGCPHTLFQGQDRDAYTRMANDNLVLVAQIETQKALDNLDSILAVPGLDVAFIGNTDLAISMGHPNNLVEGPVRDAVRHILKSAKARGIAGGGNFVNPEFVGQFYEDGLRFISLDSDIERLQAGLQAGMDTLRAGLPQYAKPAAQPPKNSNF
ncbi:HpcH/HpaI aldolase family protein [Ereboglobus luteus]|nr:aldolase/citrate lyase family protein [Ereboglobus luteus]